VGEEGPVVEVEEVEAEEEGVEEILIYSTIKILYKIYIFNNILI